MRKEIFMSVLVAGAMIAGISSFAVAETSPESGCVDEENVFYYHTYGGVIEGEDYPLGYNSTWTILGQDDSPGSKESGAWFREGPLSGDFKIMIGDQNNNNERDPDAQNIGTENTVWPALSWGTTEKGEVDPWDTGVQGDNVAGASGIGFIGYGYKRTEEIPGRRIDIGKDTVLFPLGGVQHHNRPASFLSTLGMKVSWNFELYRSGNKDVPLFKGQNYFDMYMWETLNSSVDKVCPRTETDMNAEVYPDSFNLAQKAKPGQSWWPEYGDHHRFIGDGREEGPVCADVFGFAGGVLTRDIEFKDRCGKIRKYVLSIDGFWHYYPEGTTKNGKQCPPLDQSYGGEGMPHGSENKYWDIGCFEKSESFWSRENNISAGYIRVRINEKPLETTCKDMKPIDALALTWTGGPDQDITIAKINVWHSEIGRAGNPPFMTFEDIAPGKQIIIERLAEDNPQDIVLELLDAAGNSIGNSMFHISCSEEDLNGPEDCGKTIGGGINGGGLKEWIFNGMSGESGDPLEFCE